MASTISVSSWACCASSIQWWRSRLLNCSSMPLVVADALEVVPLGHPFDLQDQQRHRQRMVRQHSPPDLLGRTDHGAGRAEARLELALEGAEQVNVLGFLAGEAQSARVRRSSLAQQRPRMVEHERQDELLDQAEGVEVAVGADVVQLEPPLGIEEVERAGAGERLGHERLAEVEAALAADDVLDAPVDLLGGCQRLGVGETMRGGGCLQHGLFSWGRCGPRWLRT